LELPAAQPVFTRRRLSALLAAPAIAAGVSGLGPSSSAQNAERRGGPSTEDLGLPAFNSVINIRDNGQADPYGSAFQVRDLKGFITDVNLILKGLRHDRPSDISILLSHQGRATVVMRGAGGTVPVRDANVLIDDEATAPLPNGTAISGGRAYQPVDYVPARGEFGGGAPGITQVPAALSAFDGQSPNGEWVLWVRDDLAQIAGSLTGWQLIITTDDPAGAFVVVDNYRVRADRRLSIPRSQGLLAIDGAQGAGSSFRVQVVAKPRRGKLALRSDGSFTYTPRKPRGRDFFTYRFQDEFGGSVPGLGRVNITIEPERNRRNR
jgi:hypothetical protein